MNKIRKFLISGLAVCAIACTAAGLAACSTNSSKYPNYRKPANYVEQGGSVDTEFKGDYTVAVTTAGGMRINGVKVDFKLNGETVISAISMDNGEITFRAEPAEYEMVVDESTLPTGYFVNGDKFTTSATSGEASVVINSKVMATTAASTYRYSLGDVMYDFSYTDNSGERQILSEILAEGSQYKAVAINFWYINCSPCRDEFPALQTAYENYKDSIKVIAVSTEDTQTAINTFRNENKYTFDMIQDYAGLCQLFSITATPATIIIDRYGVYVDYDVGKEVDSRVWSTKFARFVSDNYEQVPSSSGSTGDDETGEVYERIEPDIAEDDYNKFHAILNGSGTENKIIEYYGASSENDKQYNWPWLSDAGTELGRPHVKTTNATYGNSFSIFSVTITLERGDYISYDYYTSTELANDILYVLIDGAIVAEHSGESGDGADPASHGWLTNRAVYTATRSKTIDVSFCYLKDLQVDEGNDYVAISNITIANVRDAVDAIDMKTDASSGDVVGGKYTEYVTPYFNTADNYYHVAYEDGKDSILYVDYLNATAWSDLHLGGTTFTPNKYSTVQVASLYFMLYWDYTNWDTKNDGDLMLTFGGDNLAKYTQTFINSYYTGSFSTNGLIPASKDVKDLIEAFLKEYCRSENITYHENMWLEFCCYFMHFGNEHEFIDYDVYNNNIDITYDEANDVYRADNGSDTLDNKLYINLIRAGLFGIENESGAIDYYSIETALEDGLFKGSEYEEKIAEYIELAKSNSGDKYGMVEASSELVKILKSFLAKYGYEKDNDWYLFACYYNIGDCNTSSDPIKGMNFINAYPAQMGDNMMNVWNINTIDGGGMIAVFVPTQSGVYKFTSFNSQLGDDPHLVMYNSEYEMIAYFENLVRYDLFLCENPEDFEGYAYLNANETYYLRIAKGFQTEGKVYYNISYVGDSYSELRVASTADGLWTYDLDIGIDFAFYLAIDVDLYNNVYYHINDDGERSSVVYIDFIHPNFYEVNDHSLLWMIENGIFDFYEYGGADYTAKMYEYCLKSIDKDEDDETYGMVEASKELVNIINILIKIRNGESPETKYWLSFATYYEYYGA